MATATVGVIANDAAVEGVGDLAVVRPQDLDPDPAPNPVPDPPQKRNPEVVPGKEFCTNFFLPIIYLCKKCCHLHRIKDKNKKQHIF